MNRADKDEVEKLDEAIIAVLPNFPAVWNKKLNSHRIKARRDNALKAVGDAVGSTAKHVATRYKFLRETYRKEKRKEEDLTRGGAAGNLYEPWPLMESLRFLDPGQAPRATVSTLAKASGDHIYSAEAAPGPSYNPAEEWLDESVVSTDDVSKEVEDDDAAWASRTIPLEVPMPVAASRPVAGGSLPTATSSTPRMSPVSGPSRAARKGKGKQKQTAGQEQAQASLQQIADTAAMTAADIRLRTSSNNYALLHYLAMEMDTLPQELALECRRELFEIVYQYKRRAQDQ